MKYSMFSNMSYVYKASIKKYPRVRLYLLVNFITELLVPFLVIVITTVLVYTLTNNVNVYQYIVIMFVLTLTTFFLEALRSWSLTRYTFENTFARVAIFNNGLSEHLLKTDYINIEARNRRNIISKAYGAIMGNYYGIEMMLRQSPLMLINLCGVIVYGILIALYVPVVLVVMLIMAITNYLLTNRANKELSGKTKQLSDEFREKYYLTKDSTNPNYGKDIRIYNVGKWFTELGKRLTGSRRSLTRGIESKFLLADIVNTVFLFARDFGAYFVLLGLVVIGEIDLTTFTFFIGIVTGFTLWLNGFTSALNEMRTCNVRINDYRECISIDNEYNKKGEIHSSELRTPLTIEFDNVTFSYPEAEEPTIKNLSFKIRANEKVALVGNNGAGKTTIVKLISGLYRPESGVIKVGGYDIKKFNIIDYMSIIAAVFQDSEPFAFTIKGNIACTEDENIDDVKLKEAIKAAGLYDKVQSLDNKENTYITQVFDQSGIRLSGGETQKMMLARSLYKDSPILILDEPTAALDPIAEEELYLKYEELVKDSTSLFISHRLSSTKFCDRILLLEKGNIIEEGSHDELIKLNGEYRSIFDIQAQYYKEDNTNE
ncbi:ABC transporter ATP-binding protein [Candidatus Izemoplasma sp. B36]|uniref:ABC transporter ATP-binding protein n=1 Tax=Candidatus Izemoplasma sp. B36 TaxID=3242468 RepID=UPI003559038D